MKLFLIIISTFLFLACSSAAPVVNTTKPINVAQQTNEAQSVLAHTTEGKTPAPVNSNGGGKMSSGGDPIDTSKFDEKIKEAEKTVKAKPTDDGC